ncbi:MAG TPA: Ig-like domain-containing protein, partial [Thermoplasmata archaeon]|nr:Ig-like domain-containing protein [Thermoplasmata archaeon]
VFRSNTFDNYASGLEFQTGGVTVTGNAFTNLTEAGVWICPNNPACAGSSANTSNNVWYNNTFTFISGGYLTHMSLSNAFYNTFLGHGASQWTDGTNTYPVYGDWLFFANGPIQELAFADRPDGHRTLSLTTGGRTYGDQESLAGVTDSAALTVDGTLDYRGSVYGNTVLGALNPRGTTSLDVAGMGTTTFTIQGFAAGYVYNVSVRELSTGVYRNGTLSTDGSGFAQFSVDFGATMATYSVTLWGSFPAPPGDTTPPAQVTDVRASVTGPSYAVLQWTAPGNNGTVGRASQYDLRYSTSGPLTNATLDQGTKVATPAPGVSGSEETLNVTGLQPDTTYWFALRTADNVPNWSPISNNLKIVTSPSTRPTVQSAGLDLTAGAIDLLFSSPMNRSSVEGAIRISNAISYHAVWVDDRHLRIVLDEPLGPGLQYTLTVAANATDRNGLALGTPFTYTFTGAQAGRSTNPAWDPWVGLAIALGLSAILVLFVIFRDRAIAGLGKGIHRMVRTVRRPPKKPPRPPDDSGTDPRRD